LLVATLTATLWSSDSPDGFVICGPDLYLTLKFGTDFVYGGRHPNGQGHDKIADALYSQLLAVPNWTDKPPNMSPCSA